MTKRKVPGIKLVQPLMFDDWPEEQILPIIAKIQEEYDLSNFELDYINRGGYTKCRGNGDHKACDELIITGGQIVFKLKEASK